MSKVLMSINPALDYAALAKKFNQHGRVQVRDFLAKDAAQNMCDVLQSQTPWGLAWRAQDRDPCNIRNTALSALTRQEHAARDSEIIRTMQHKDGYAFQFASYPMLDAYLEQWAPNSAHDMILEHLNDAPFLDAVRRISGIPELRKADAQATLYAPGHFLAEHNDSHVKQGWRLAYVLNLCPVDWRPDWGGYLNFMDDDGDIICGWKPRFNSLNLFAVPQQHNVSFVPPFAPAARFAITGWVRDQ